MFRIQTMSHGYIDGSLMRWKFWNYIELITDAKVPSKS